VVSKDLLPFACLTIGVKGGGWPLENIVFESAITHKTITFVFNKSFNSSHPDYLTAVENSDKVLCMAIVHLEPGDYIINRIEFSPTVRNAVATTEFDFSREHGYRFTILPNAANYLGTLTITPDWRVVDSVLVPSHYNGKGKFAANFVVESTQVRDKKWAEDMIPGLTIIAAVSGHIEAF